MKTALMYVVIQVVICWYVFPFFNYTIGDIGSSFPNYNPVLVMAILIVSITLVFFQTMVSVIYLLATLGEKSK